MNNTAAAPTGLEDTLDLYFGQKAPPMPANVKELLVRFAPWVTLVLLLITLPAVLIALGLLPAHKTRGLGNMDLRRVSSCPAS